LLPKAVNRNPIDSIEIMVNKDSVLVIRMRDVYERQPVIEEDNSITIE